MVPLRGRRDLARDARPRDRGPRALLRPGDRPVGRGAHPVVLAARGPHRGRRARSTSRTRRSRPRRRGACSRPTSRSSTRSRSRRSCSAGSPSRPRSRATRRQVNALYFSDLIGAGLGCAIVVLLLEVAGAPAAILLCERRVLRRRPVPAPARVAGGARHHARARGGRRRHLGVPGAERERPRLGRSRSSTRSSRATRRASRTARAATGRSSSAGTRTRASR